MQFLLLFLQGFSSTVGQTSAILLQSGESVASMNRLTAKTPVMVQQVDLKSLVASYCVVGFSSLLSVQLFSNLPNPVVLQARHAAWAPSATADHAPAKHDDHHHHHVHVKPSLNDGIPPEHLVAPYGDPNKMLGVSGGRN